MSRWTGKQAELLKLAITLSNMTTPTDGVDSQERCDDIMAELDDETLCSDAAALYAMIRQARKIVAMG